MSNDRLLFPVLVVEGVLSVADPPMGGPPFEGLTMNVEFCEENSSRSKKMRYFRKNSGEGGGRAPKGPSLGPPLVIACFLWRRVVCFKVARLDFLGATPLKFEN